MTAGAPFRVSVVLLLCVATILLFQLVPRYTVHGPELLINSGFRDNFQGWSKSDSGMPISSPDLAIAQLRSIDASRSVQLSQDILDAPAYQLLSLACDIKTADVLRGAARSDDQTWYSARVLLIPFDQEGKPNYSLPHSLGQFLGTHDWEHHEKVFIVYPGTTRFSVVAQLAHVRGSVWVRNMSLRQAEVGPFYRKVRKFAILLWLATAIWAIVPLARSAYGQVQRTGMLALACLISLGVVIPEDIKERVGSAMLPLLHKATFATADPVTPEFFSLLPAFDVYKVGHIVLFAMLAAVALYRTPYPGVSKLRIVGYLLLFALVTEVVQLMAAGRHAQLADILIDGMGMFAGFLLLIVMTKWGPGVKWRKM